MERRNKSICQEMTRLGVEKEGTGVRSGRTKEKVTSHRNHLLNEHIYTPDTVLRILHSQQNLMQCVLALSSDGKVTVPILAAHTLKSDEKRKAQDCIANT